MKPTSTPRLLLGNSRERIKLIPRESVDAIARARIEHYTLERVEDSTDAPERPERKQEVLF